MFHMTTTSHGRRHSRRMTNPATQECDMSGWVEDTSSADRAPRVAEWYRYRTVACFVTGSSRASLKTRRVGQSNATLNLSRAEL
ncbi:hypothetical protein TNCV_4561551 [Trichonephila clavipes]|nr:hypothetical protein TNCV_4561551 [Trichonephila clavipes]